jgi:hypothetical protein
MPSIGPQSAWLPPRKVIIRIADKSRLKRRARGSRGVGEMYTLALWEAPL